MTNTASKNGAIVTERVLRAEPTAVFAAFERPERLAKWWGPAGFTNTIDAFAFEPGGRWKYVMHGPDGRDYANESTFREIEPYERIVIDHISLPKYDLTIKIAADGGRTHLTWVQEFENNEFALRMKDFLSNANEENLDRLEKLLADIAEAVEDR